MTGQNWTLRFPRTTRCDGHAIYYYRTPLTKRLFFALIKHGWWAVFLAVLLLSGCADMQAEEDSAADLRDAQALAYQAAKGVSHE